MADIETLMDTQCHELPEESKFLLEFDMEQQKYWIYATKAVQKAGHRQAIRGR